MRTILIPVFTLVLLIPFLACAQEGSVDASKCFEVVGTSDFYFGTIDQDSTVTHTFVFKNKCSSAIEIERAAPSCGCTAAILSEKVIQPGSEAKIEVKFTPPKGTRGKSSKTVSLYLKGESQPHTILRFSADVKSDIELNPQYVQLLGAVVGEKTTGKATVRNTSESVLEVNQLDLSMTTYSESTDGTNASMPYPLKSVSAIPEKMTLKPGEAQDFTITVTPDRRGQVNGTLRFKAGNNEAYLQIFGIVREKTDEVKPNQTNDHHSHQH